MNTELSQKVLQKVQACMGSLVGGSGHLASYEILPDTFNITRIEELQGGLKKYSFEAKGYRESEFAVYDDVHPPEAKHISDSIVLDKNLELARDERGRVMLEPWTYVD
jgi:hypothetical protein